MATATKQQPKRIHRFPITQRIQAYEMALERGLHLVRDNYHLWAIRLSDKAHVWICSSASYDGLWREACNTFRDPSFDTETLPYAVEEHENVIDVYNPATGETEEIDKKDLRSRRGD